MMLPSRGLVGTKQKFKPHSKYRPFAIKYTEGPAINKPVKCVVSTKEIPFHLLRPDGKDVIFLDKYGNILPYWIENKNNTLMRVWLKFPKASGSFLPIYIYYNNLQDVKLSHVSAAFKYRRKIIITEQSGSDLTDYQVAIELSSTNFDFTHAQANGDDIRFADANGNPLSYWIEEWDSVNKKAKVWVKVPSIPANSSVEIWMYYGNDGIDSASSGKDTSMKFYSFEDCHRVGWTLVTDTNNQAIKINNKVLIGFHDPDLGKSGILMYDETTSEWIRYTIGTVNPSEDHHPAVPLETENYILVFIVDVTTSPIQQLFAYRYDYNFNHIDTIHVVDYHIAFPQFVKLNNGRIYCFFRDDSDPAPVWKYKYSDDEGATWSTETQVTTGPKYGTLNYCHVATDGEKIYLTYCEFGGNPDLAHGIWFMYMDTDGQWKKDDGTVISLPASPDDMSRPTNKNSHSWQILYYSGKVYIYYHYEPDTGSYEYYRLIWDGNNWTDEFICDSNRRGLFSDTSHYALGLCAKQENPNIVYASVDVNGVAEIQKWEFINGSWTKTEDVTKNSKKDNWRPLAIRGNGDFDVVWQVVVGYYRDWDEISGIYLGARNIYPDSLIDWEPVSGHDAWIVSEERSLEGKRCAEIRATRSGYQNISSFPFTFGFFLYDDLGASRRVLGGATSSSGTAISGIAGLNTEKSADYYVFRHDSAWEVSSIPRSQGWHKIEVKVQSSSQLAIYIDEEKVWEGSVSNVVDSIAVANWWSGEEYKGWADCIYVRKFASVEPSVSLGKEEAA